MNDRDFWTEVFLERVRQGEHPHDAIICANEALVALTKLGGTDCSSWTPTV